MTISDVLDIGIDTANFPKEMNLKVDLTVTSTGHWDACDPDVQLLAPPPGQLTVTVIGLLPFNIPAECAMTYCDMVLEVAGQSLIVHVEPCTMA
ncbi:MAG TPA: hypothetical protein VME66_03725 [Candidatus Acidoferrales bacterium]|nr:hypothetical protein [Candidatus Acidoferrales bacterium]